MSSKIPTRRRKQKRDKEISIAVNADEKALITAAAQERNMPVATFLRNLLLADEIKLEKPKDSSKRPRRPVPKADPVLIQNVVMVGNRLNQLARWAELNMDRVDALSILIELNAVQNVLSKFVCDEIVEDAA